MAFSTLALFSGCKKELDAKLKQANTDPNQQTATEAARTKQTNPYSRANIEKSMIALGRPVRLDPNRLYNYYRFAPNLVTGAVLAMLEADTSSKILDFPMGNMALYPKDGRAVSQAEIEATKDGNLYIVLKANSDIDRLFGPSNSLNATLLEELYMPEPSDEDLQLQALLLTGYIGEPGMTVTDFRIRMPKIPGLCLLKRPSGKITYTDDFNNTDIAVPQIEVWALAFGLISDTKTNNNGDYSINFLYSVATIMGTEAENFRVNVKPLNTTGTWAGAALSIISNFIIGSNFVKGSFSSCDMNKPININFSGHDQPKYWAQILTLIKHHHDYAGADQIHAAPNQLTLYAQWDATTGDASAPMLGHLQTSDAAIFASLASYVFGINLAVTLPNIFNLLTGLPPDITMKQSPFYSGNQYSMGMSQTMFHELGHASLFRQVGQLFWVKVIGQVLAQNGYGTPTGLYWGLIQVNEAWAEFIGKEHYRRFHNGGSVNVIRYDEVNLSWLPYLSAQEDVPWFNKPWINTGVFYDIMDGANEPDDLIQGYSIKNMYNCFSPSTSNLCDWKVKFLQANPSINYVNLDRLMVVQNKCTQMGCQ